MRRLVLVLVLALVAALLAGGCNTRQRVAGAGVGLAVVGLTMTFSTDVRSEEESGTEGKIGIALLLTGVVTLFVAAALEESATKEPPKEIRVSRGSADPDPAATTAQQTRDRAWQLTRQAQAAARANECAKVTELSAQVGALDREFYASVFLQDVAIQHCFTPPEPAPTAPPTSPAPVPSPASP